MISIPIRLVVLRLALLIVWAAGIGWLGWTLTRAALGDSYSTYLERNPNLSNEARLAGAASATDYAPNDPLVRWQSGGAYLTVASEEQAETLLPRAVAELGQAVQQSPDDFRIQLTLGRALDRSGATDEARAAFERAAQLAPNHFDTQWGLGNHLLRAGQSTAAFTAMRKALRTRPAAMPLVFDYAWQAFDGNSQAVIKALSDGNAANNNELAVMLINRDQVAEALTLWRAVAKPTPAETLKLIETLAFRGRFKAAYELWRAANDLNLPQPEENSLLANGSFEQNFDPASKLPMFAWNSTASPHVNISLDQQSRSAGQLSLRLRFDLQDNQTLLLITQTVPVKPNTSYCLSFAHKTEALQSLSTPLLGIYDAADEKRLAVTTAPLPNGTRDWSETMLRFTTKADTEAVTVRLQRLSCAEPPCPLTGRLWLDNFKLNECAQ